MERIDFKVALERAEGTTKNLLLGNGFSIALDESKFSYKSLFEAAQFDSTLKDIFKYLDTCDFEKVMKALDDAEKILLLYDQEEQSTELLNGIKNGTKKLKGSLIKAIQENHPEDQSCLKNKDFYVSQFLAQFIPKKGNSGKIFTLNYDLLLYWVLMRDSESKESKLQFDDGFSKADYCGFSEPDCLRWHSFYAQTIYYLHGALHLYDEDIGIRKLKWQQGKDLPFQITKKIEDGDFPMFVSEGSSFKKSAKIQHNPYLYHAFNAFTDVMMCEDQSLFIFGCSFNETDAHIFDAIEDGKIKKVFVSVCDNQKEEDRHNFYGCVFKRFKREDIKITFFTAESAHVWE